MFNPSKVIVQSGRGIERKGNRGYEKNRGCDDFMYIGEIKRK
jgi:hypothetical protein